MAEVIQTAEKTQPTNVGDNAGGINLVDLAKPIKGDKPTIPMPSIVKPPDVVTLPPVVPPTLHIEPPKTDADLNRRYVYLDPRAWNNDAALRDIYENGVIKLHTDLDGRRQFGLRITEDKNMPVVPMGRGHAGDKGVSLQFRLKF